MPIKLLNKDECETLKTKGFDLDTLNFLDENARSYLKLRDTDKVIKSIGTKQHKGLQQV